MTESGLPLREVLSTSVIGVSERDLRVPDERNSRVFIPSGRCREVREIGANISTLQTRSEKFGDTFTQTRAHDAYKAYISHRNLTDQQKEKENLKRSLGVAMRSKDRKRHDEIQKQILLNGKEHVPQGGEVVFACENYEEARLRTIELIGPASLEMRKYTYCRLGEYKASRDQGAATPTSGFTANIPFDDGKGSSEWHRVWRLDYDAELGPHINVCIRPPRSEYQTNGNQSNKNRSASTLNIVFSFSGSQSDYRALLDATEETLTVAEVDRGKGHDLDYLPEMEQPHFS